MILLLNKLDRSLFDPVLGVLSRQEDDILAQVNIPVVCFGMGGPPVWRILAVIGRLCRYLRRRKFDIVQAQFLNSTIYLALAVRFLSKKPKFIAAQRNTYHWIDEHKIKFRLLKWTKRWTDLVIANSCCAADACHALECVPKKKIRVVYNAVEMEKLNGISKAVAKQRLGLEGKHPVVGVLSNLRPVKGISCFLHAAALTAEALPNAHFVIAGSGPQEHELKDLSIRLRLDGRVSFLGDVQDIGPVLASFDIAVQPSLSESLSNSLLEYMAAEQPVVATRTGDAERLIQRGFTGLLVEPDDAAGLCSSIRWIYDNPGNARQIAARAKERVTYLSSVPNAFKKYERLYSGITQERT